MDNAFQDGLSAAVGYGVAKGLNRLTSGKGDGSPPADPPAALYHELHIRPGQR